MEVVNIEKLSDYKILPFDIFDEAGNVIFTAGEVLTAGKIMQLKKHESIYRMPPKKVKESFEETEKKQTKESYDTPKKEEPKKEEPKKEEHIIEDMAPNQIVSSVSPIDKIDAQNYVGPVNINSLIDTKTQIQLKAFYYMTQKDFKNTSTTQTVKNYITVRNKIYNDLDKEIEKANFFSELKLLGEYTKCHDLNVAILASAFGKKYGLKNEEIQELILAALLHDIGKKYLPEKLLSKQTLTWKEKMQLESHTKIGYDVIKNHLKLPEKIAVVALHHHERVDGSGYPDKISEESIDLFSQIVGLCSFFDNLTFNKTEVKVKNVHEALRYIIEKCTKYYSSDILYTFVYMFSYNDVKNFEDMVM